ncbi:S24 family peptidase [Clostridium perfringens]|uniref:helix-turn-helix domain-containing protein n=1 Tax=Clostridium perfringens TaxID=1502 RepID=UPI0022474682|nr:S24 family peptidase [Clostridium perfringens]MCX0368364.1 helix-turn-helix domain-containing protein [Clostridium perfringens]
MNLEKLAKIIKKYRKDNNLTQQQLAEKLDISRSVLSYYENTNAEPNLYFLYNFSRLLNCTIDELVDSADIFDDFSLSQTPQNEFEPIKKAKTKIKEDTLNINDGQKFLKEIKNMLNKVKKTYDELNYSKLRIDRTLTELDRAINRANRTKEDLNLSLRRVNRLYDDLKRTNSREERFDKLVKQLDDISKNLNPNFENDIIDMTDIEISTDLVPSVEELRKNKILEFKNKSKESNSKYIRIPILGVVAAGNPSYACENILDNIYLPKGNFSSSFTYFGLKVKGDSMNELFEDGEVIIIRKTSLVHNDDIVIAFVGDEATCKEYYYDGNNNNINLIPHSTNSKHKKQVYSVDEVKIIGLVEGSLNDFLDSYI